MVLGELEPALPGMFPNSGRLPVPLSLPMPVSPPGRFVPVFVLLLPVLPLAMPLAFPLLKPPPGHPAA